MPYTIRYSTPSKIIVVQDNVINTDTSMSFVGKEYTNYAPVIAENFLHLLEHFANTVPPLNPVPGQLWFNSVNNTLSLYNSANWKELGLITNNSTPPLYPKVGELWVDSVNKVLKLYTGSDWLIIGPGQSGEVRDGAYTETVQDSNDNFHRIILLYIQDVVVAIISKDSMFELKSSAYGYNTISPGINLSPVIYDINFCGNAISADSLSIGAEIVPATSFLRADTTNVLSFLLQVQADAGITLGQRSDFSLAVIDDIPTILSGSAASAPGDNVSKDINFDVYPITGARLPVIKVKPTGQVIIGNDPDADSTILPTDLKNSKVYLNGDVYIKGKLTLAGTVISNDPDAEQLEADIDYNTAGSQIGRRISDFCSLEGVWVGSIDSVTAPIDVANYDQFTTNTSYSIMRVTSDGSYTLHEFRTDGATGASMGIMEHTGHFNKLREQCYLRVRDGTGGTWLAPATVNPAHDTLNITYIGPPDDGGPAPTLRNWRTHTYFNVSRESTDYETIKADLFDNFAYQWPHE